MVNDSSQDAQIVVRLPAALKEWAQEQAKHHRRSLNAQMLVWLEEIQAGTNGLPATMDAAVESAPEKGL